MTNRIREAIRVLARTGWTKDAFTDESGRHCLQGALYEAHCLEGPTHEQLGGPLGEELMADMTLVNETVRAQFPDRVGGVGASRFNDHPETTLGDVITVLEKAAVRKDEQV